MPRTGRLRASELPGAGVSGGGAATRLRAGVLVVGGGEAGGSLRAGVLAVRAGAAAGRGNGVVSARCAAGDGADGRLAGGMTGVRDGVGVSGVRDGNGVVSARRAAGGATVRCGAGGRSRRRGDAGSVRSSRGNVSQSRSTPGDR